MLGSQTHSTSEFPGTVHSPTWSWGWSWRLLRHGFWEPNSVFLFLLISSLLPSPLPPPPPPPPSLIFSLLPFSFPLPIALPPTRQICFLRQVILYGWLQATTDVNRLGFTIILRSSAPGRTQNWVCCMALKNVKTPRDFPSGYTRGTSPKTADRSRCPQLSTAVPEEPVLYPWCSPETCLPSMWKCLFPHGSPTCLSASTCLVEM